MLGANPFPMAIWVDELVVVLHNVDVREHLGHEFPRHVTGCLDGGVETTLVGFCQECGTEIGLQQALSAAQRDSPTGLM